LTEVVEDTLAGQYWNSAIFAMTTLSKYNAPGCSDLLKRFHAFSMQPAKSINGAQHPGRPTLAQEKQHAKELTARKHQTLNAVEQLLNERDAACKNATLEEDHQNWLKRFLVIARDYQ